MVKNEFITVEVLSPSALKENMTPWHHILLKVGYQVPSLYCFTWDTVGWDGLLPPLLTQYWWDLVVSFFKMSFTPANL